MPENMRDSEDVHVTWLICEQCCIVKAISGGICMVSGLQHLLANLDETSRGRSTDLDMLCRMLTTWKRGSRRGWAIVGGLVEGRLVEVDVVSIVGKVWALLACPGVINCDYQYQSQLSRLTTYLVEQQGQPSRSPVDDTSPPALSEKGVIDVGQRLSSNL